MYSSSSGGGLFGGNKKVYKVLVCNKDPKMGEGFTNVAGMGQQLVYRARRHTEREDAIRNNREMWVERRRRRGKPRIRMQLPCPRN